MSNDKGKRGKERKDREVHMRFTKAEVDLLDMLSYEEDRTKTDTVVKALTWYANFKKGHINGTFN